MAHRCPTHYRAHTGFVPAGSRRSHFTPFFRTGFLLSSFWITMIHSHRLSVHTFVVAAAVVVVSCDVPGLDGLWQTD